MDLCHVIVTPFPADFRSFRGFRARFEWPWEAGRAFWGLRGQRLAKFAFDVQGQTLLNIYGAGVIFKSVAKKFHLQCCGLSKQHS